MSRSRAGGLEGWFPLRGRWLGYAAGVAALGLGLLPLVIGDSNLYVTVGLMALLAWIGRPSPEPAIRFPLGAWAAGLAGVGISIGMCCWLWTLAHAYAHDWAVAPGCGTVADAIASRMQNGSPCGLGVLALITRLLGARSVPGFVSRWALLVGFAMWAAVMGCLTVAIHWGR